MSEWTLERQVSVRRDGNIITEVIVRLGLPRQDGTQEVQVTDNDGFKLLTIERAKGVSVAPNYDGEYTE